MYIDLCLVNLIWLLFVLVEDVVVLCIVFMYGKVVEKGFGLLGKEIVSVFECIRKVVKYFSY